MDFPHEIDENRKNFAIGYPTARLGLGVLCFYFCAIMLLTIMLSEFTILERDYATYMLA